MEKYHNRIHKDASSVKRWLRWIKMNQENRTETTRGFPRTLWSVVDSTGWALKGKMTQEMWYSGASKGCVRRSWVPSLGQNLKYEPCVPGRDRGARQRSTPAAGWLWDTVPLHLRLHPFQPELTTVFLKTWEPAIKGRNSLQWLQWVCWSRVPLSGWGSFLFCSIMGASLQLSLLRASPEPPPFSHSPSWSPCTGAGDQRGPCSIVSLREAQDVQGAGAGAVPEARAGAREMGACRKLLVPPCAKPWPLGWLLSCLRWLQVNVKPLEGLPKGRELEWGRKEWESLGDIFLGLFTALGYLYLPGGHLEHHWFIIALPSSVSFPRQSQVKVHTLQQRSLDNAKTDVSASKRKTRCWFKFSVFSPIAVLESISNILPLSGQFPVLGGEIKSRGSLASLAEVPWDNWGLRECVPSAET